MLDILVNNAAANETPTPIAELDLAAHERTMAVNARAVFLTVRHAARTMRDGGRIVTIWTLNMTRPAPGISVYAGSKAAVEQFTAAAAIELAARGSTANSVSPGATDTELLRSTNSEEGLAFAVRLTPLGRLGLPADVADIVGFLVGPAAG